jgi:hypothetical protein
MSAAKDHFLRDRALSDQYRAAVNSDWFARALMFVDAELLECCNPDDLRGARLYKLLLLSLADVDKEPFKSSKPRLHQNFDQQPPARRPKVKPQPKSDNDTKTAP